MGQETVAAWDIAETQRLIDHPAARLLRSPNGAFTLTFLHRAFKEHQAISVPESHLRTRLENFLDEAREPQTWCLYTDSGGLPFRLVRERARTAQEVLQRGSGRASLQVDYSRRTARRWLEDLQGERTREFVLTREVEAKYLEAVPEPLADIAILMLDTGLRDGEALALSGPTFTCSLRAARNSEISRFRRESRQRHRAP